VPDWRDEVCVALKAWLAVEGGSGQKPSWKLVGRARPEGAEGWYQVDLRGTKVSEEQFERLRLAGARAPASGPAGSDGGNGKAAAASSGDAENAGYAVMDAVLDGAVLRVRVAEFAEVDDPHLWTYRQPPAFLTAALHDGIANLTEPGLAHVLARGELNGTSAAPNAAGLVADGGRVLNEQQAEAYRAALGTGLWLVWGPPGTGKTEVLRRAIGDLLNAGRRVLLVSATNIAVDNALLRVVRDQPRVPGRMVRVGTPQLPEIAADPNVALPALVRTRLSHLEQQRQQVENRLMELRRNSSELAECRKRITGFDQTAYAAARQVTTSDPDSRHAALSEALSTARTQAEAAARAARQAQDRAKQATAEYAAAEPSLRTWRQIGEIIATTNRTTKAAADQAAQILQANASVQAATEKLAAWEAQPALKRRLTRGEGEQLKQQQADWLRHASALRDEVHAAQAIAKAHYDRAQADVAHLTQQAGLSREQVGALETAAHATRDELTAATNEFDARLARHTAAQAELDRFRSAAAVVIPADRAGLPAVAARAAQLQRLLGTGADKRTAFEKEHARLEAEYDRLSRDASGEIVRGARLVATTLARFRINAAVLAGPYDAVFIDEVGSAALPEVLLAVAKAGRVAVMLGDFMQLGAVGLDDLAQKVKQPVFTKWVARDVFEHCGIAAPADARSHPRCISLQEQHRFGLDVMELANRCAYDGLLQAGPGPRNRGRGSAHDPQIILLDTDGLGALEHIYRTNGRVSGWWAAGTMLSRAVAELHAAEHKDVGIVTPYTAQAEASLEALRDLEASGGVFADVGTAHRFQGREFPVVVFDTVENRDSGGGWIAKASRAVAASSWQRSGLRLFNVASTRVQQTLYIIASGDRVLNAAPGTPLAVLRDLVRDNRAVRMPASRYVGGFGDIPAEHGELVGQLGEVLARHVEVAALDDERSFYKTFVPRIEAARSSIWLWAPWSLKRSKAIIPALTDAAARGVRVVVFTRGPEDKLHELNPEQLTALRAAGFPVVLMHKMHQKIAIFDESVTLYGSLNPLSQSDTRETMMTLLGGALARRILKEEHAAAFSKPPRCGACRGTDVDLRRGSGRNDGWYWRCFSQACPGRAGTKAWTQKITF
jgi:hypothetical protein